MNASPTDPSQVNGHPAGTDISDIFARQIGQTERNHGKGGLGSFLWVEITPPATSTTYHPAV